MAGRITCTTTSPKSIRIHSASFSPSTPRGAMFDSLKALTDEEGFQFVESQSPMVDPVNVVYKTKEIQTSATTLFDLGHNDVTRSWVFSKGDSTTP